MMETDKANLVAATADGEANDAAAASANDGASELSPWQRVRRCKCPPPRGMALIVLVSGVFSAVITVALILTIIFGEPQVQKLGAVAADTTEASQCGLEMLSDGGTAVDAAAAAALCGAVVQYPITGLGSGGLLLVHNHRAAKTTLLDFLEAAPANASAAMFARNEAAAYSTALGTGVPGFMLGLAEAHKRFGRLKWSTLFEPAIRLAIQGFRVSADLNRLLASNAGRISGNSLLKRWYFTPPPAGGVKPVGAMVTMPELAGALGVLRDRGVGAMYSGPLSEEFLAASNAHGGWLTLNDLAGYKVIERKPLQGHYRNHTVVTFPAPSAGGAFTLLVAQILAGYPEASNNAANATGLLQHHAAEAMKLALGALLPRFGDAAALAEAASGGFADRLRARIQDGRVLNASEASPEHPWPPAGHPGTASSQLVAVDNEELYVAMETSLNVPFGTGIVTNTSGLVLNNALANFELRAEATGNHSNAPAAGQRPATLMAPAFAFNPRQRCGLRFAFGSANVTSVPGTAAWLLVKLADLAADSTTCPQNVASRRRSSKRQHCLPTGAAMRDPRLSPLLPAPPAHQSLLYEPGLPSAVKEFLLRVGHRLTHAPLGGLGRGQIVAMDLYSLAAQSDSSRSGAKAAMLPQSQF